MTYVHFNNLQRNGRTSGRDKWLFKNVAHLTEVLFSTVLTVMSAEIMGSLASKLMESGRLICQRRGRSKPSV